MLYYTCVCNDESAVYEFYRRVINAQHLEKENFTIKAYVQHGCTYMHNLETTRPKCDIAKQNIN